MTAAGNRSPAAIHQERQVADPGRDDEEAAEGTDDQHDADGPGEVAGLHHQVGGSHRLSWLSTWIPPPAAEGHHRAGHELVHVPQQQVQAHPQHHPERAGQHVAEHAGRNSPADARMLSAVAVGGRRTRCAG
jgi:hypothetical protein